MSAAVLVVVLKVLNVADRVYNRIFEAISRENLNELLSEKLNKLSAIIFDMIKH